MISFENALEIINGASRLLPCESVTIENAAGRVLSENIVSDVNIPPANMSAMDGFACRASDRSMALVVIETIAAGAVPRKTISKGTCSRIMTGAMVPPEADCVVMFENSEENDNVVTVAKLTNDMNIRYMAEDAAAGDVILSKGELISPATCAVLATAGRISVPVARKPSVGIIATGNELVEPDKTPDVSQIRNSNSYQLYAQILQCGCIPRYYGIADDTIDNTRQMIKKAVCESDVIIVSGGVSAGDFDFVPTSLKDCGFNLLIEGIAVKPGKPAVFGVSKEKYAFGMPGNPVSTYVLFELLVKPFLYKMMGYVYQPLKIKVPLSKQIKKKKGDRLEIIPVRFTPDGAVEKVSYHGSAHIHAYSSAQGFLFLDKDVETLSEGTVVTVQLIEK